jgi:RHS repeat-associated protein
MVLSTRAWRLAGQVFAMGYRNRRSLRFDYNAVINRPGESLTRSVNRRSSVNRLTNRRARFASDWAIRSSVSKFSDISENRSKCAGGDLTSITDPLSHQIDANYNFQGQLTSITDPQNDTTQFAYNYGDLASITDPVGNVTRLYNDNAGRMVSVLDPIGNLTQMSYDNLDHITQITDALNGVTSFGYDGNENLLSVTDAQLNKTSYAYNKMNRRNSRTDARGKTETWNYDLNESITQHTDRRGIVTIYQYDGLDRMTFAGFGYNGTSYASTINYTWDGGNRLTQVVDTVAGTIARTYEGLDRLTEEQTPQGDVTYGYDNANRRTSMNFGQTVAYTWDNANRLIQIAQGTSMVSFAYDNANRRTTLTLPNGVTMAYAYDADSRVSGITYTSGSTQLGNLSYSYDADGRRTSAGGSLAAVTLPASASGNTFNADNGVTGFNGTTLTYDANGNLTGDGTNTYTWNKRNQLSAISGATSASYIYDTFGRRISETVGGVPTEFLYDGLNLIQQTMPTVPNTFPTTILTGLGFDERFTRSGGDTFSGLVTREFLTDALGSTIALTDTNGAVQTQYTYEPFGKVSVGGASDSNPYQFTGRENDGTGLYFYRARYYSPTFQRFISQDPVLRLSNGLVWLLLSKRAYASQRLNAYVFVLNDPLLFLDPLGLDPLCVGQWIPVAQNDIAAPMGDPLTGGGTGFCFCYWGCRACNGSLDLYNSDYNRPWTSGVNTGSGECVAPPPGPQTVRTANSEDHRTIEGETCSKVKRRFQP